MVDMAVRDQDRVEPLDLCAKGLLPKIDRRIDQDLFVVMLDEDRDAKALIAGIIGETCLAVASYRRNAGRSACAKKR